MSPETSAADTDFPTAVDPAPLTSPSLLSTPEWELFRKHLHDSLVHLESSLGPSVSLLQTSNGKQLRPLLVFSAAALFSPPREETVQAAVAAELIHLASLVHDDVIDQAPLRRGQPSINAAQGNQTAVLAGDSLFAEAFRVLSAPGLIPVMPYFVAAIQAMCAGEIRQGQSQFALDRSRRDYLHRSGQKTGSLIEACCRAGATIAGADKTDVNRLGKFGRFLGIGFQVVDDVLDFTGQEKELGKPTGNDFRQGNLTLPIIYLLQDPTYGTWFRETLEKKTWPPTLAFQTYKALEQSGALERSRDTAEAYIAKAKKVLSPFPPSAALDLLSEITQGILDRLPAS
ncbi:Isoprenoid synthase domain protein [Acididesulfobacillus acetoxydans]|uniref:Heptaprenyl diphosphate synthase component 2 n=1 Tax=Acididesulfobacillus acetoxydans TaxID=1561005 RepID=A0A8S0Y1Q2_9FIRM|nr:polyprenyl synthetase family protein [Acididesulfobacillus acetoxydans]CAA7599795.1 Isoprenoid synthase domain protein [Acididesulfobacillus acetoxydans]CEJ07361.1 Heptaprenyl diphosphate synthase component 2 [Acididesulfobacillus acetoxydans]